MPTPRRLTTATSACLAALWLAGCGANGVNRAPVVGLNSTLHGLDALATQHALALPGVHAQDLVGFKVAPAADGASAVAATDRQGDGASGSARAGAALAPASGAVTSLPGPSTGQAGDGAYPAAGAAAGGSAISARAAVASAQGAGLQGAGGAATGAGKLGAVNAAGAATDALKMGADPLGLVPQAAMSAQHTAVFSDDFAMGLARWQVMTPPGAASAGPAADAWKVVDLDPGDVVPHALSLLGAGPLAATLRVYYLQTAETVDLTRATQPRLRVTLRNAAAADVSFKAVWQSADAAHPEETMLGPAFKADTDWSTREFDLGSLAARKGRLILAARASQGAEPMIGDVTIYDQASARTASGIAAAAAAN